MKDAEDSFSQFSIKPRREWIELSEGLSFKFFRAGHIIGSSIVQFRARMKTDP